MRSVRKTGKVVSRSGGFSSRQSQPQTPTDPADPANNSDCCEFGQLFICPLPEGIEYEILCSAIDPPIDGEKMYKVRFFAVDEVGNRIVPEDEIGSEVLEHKEILTLPCTSEVCRTVDLSGTTLNGVDIGEVTYGNQEGCCGIFFLEIARVGPLGTLNNLDWIRGQTSFQETFSDVASFPAASPFPYNVDLNIELNFPLVLREEDLNVEIPYSVVATLGDSDIEILNFNGGFGPRFPDSPISPNSIADDSDGDLQGPVFQIIRTGTFIITALHNSGDALSSINPSVGTPIVGDLFGRNGSIRLGGVAIRYVR